MRDAKFTHYKPKRWQPEFDLIVIESISGKGNEEIGRIYGYTKEHISNILSTEEAKKVRERIRGNIEEGSEKAIRERISRIGEKAIAHLEEFIMDSNDLAHKSPFNFIDRAVKIASSVGVIGSEDKGSKASVNIGNAIIVSNDKANDLINAMNISSSLDSIPVLDPIKKING